ncbi:MAG TPA: pyridoxal 5'-phosphate synthase glutaminase subunit PdxT [Syntrophomonadaceae bacterium]|nr:pyridoxal 5'-phosphate synthase glutaminase subunit PdxT [Syntrophomonadaceae bacterium]
MAGKPVGILALQGAFIEHQACLKKCGAHPLQVRTREELDQVEALIIPGGESTTIGKLMRTYQLEEPIKEKTAQGMPLWGTCAGMILLAKEIADTEQPRLGLMDMLVKRNAYGRQVDSFETELDVDGVGLTRGVFIRAPYVEKLWGEARALCTYREKIIMVQQRNLLATAFHPELTDQLDIHKYFLELI